MGYYKDCEFPSELLAKVASKAIELLFPIAIKNKNAVAGAVATRISSIKGELLSQSLYELPTDAQQLSEGALNALLDICLWPVTSSSKAFSHRKESLGEVYRNLCDRFQKDPEKTKQSITKFCKERRNTIEHFETFFVNLADKLSKNSDDLHGFTNDSNACSHMQPQARDVYPDEVHQLLLDGIERYSACKKDAHKDDSPGSSELHITRLCLSSGFRSSEDQLALFDIIMASSQMSYWQEMTINIPIEDHDSKRNQDRQQRAALDSRSLTLIESGKICEWLEKPTYAKICLNLDQDNRLYSQPDFDLPLNIHSGCGIRLSQLLKEAELTIEHKIKLSYTVARAFWQFYSSDLMKARWTSEDIWFIHLDKTFVQSDDIPLRAFVSFPFGSQFHEAPGECCGKGESSHCYPRILYLGIILLEIGLGQSLSTRRCSVNNLAGHITSTHWNARAKLSELKKADWDGFQWKDYYVKAIGNCLEPVKFKDTTVRKEIRPQGGRSDIISLLDQSLEERRRALFQNVVTPLFWLATVGFDNSEEVLRVPIRKKLQRQSAFAGDDELQEFWREKRALPSFSSTGIANTEEYLADLRKIADHIERYRRKAKIKKPIRVAILDTGCKIDLAFFQNPNRSKRIRGWKDFTASGSAVATDVFGHGTFMARLLMDVAPIVEVYLVRVAEKTDDLQNSQNMIAEAIEHAGLDPKWNVDIVSMSFGYFDKPGMSHTIIEEAIEKVKKGRKGKILFLASAGNSSKRREDFPASHKDVISIYAGDSEGVFLKKSPAHSGKKLGTYGKDIPSSIVDEVKECFPDADLSSGTSIATAIAAGIVAMMLSYAEALTSLMGRNAVEEICAKLFTKKGMEHMLEAMSPPCNNKEHFINPIWFWGENDKDMDIFLSICAAIGQINK